MKILIVDGWGDYTATTFVSHFRGTKVSLVIDNLETYKKEFIKAEPDYEEDLQLSIVELDINIESFDKMKKLLGDEESQKHKDIFSENHIF